MLQHYSRRYAICIDLWILLLLDCRAAKEIFVEECCKQAENKGKKPRFHRAFLSLRIRAPGGLRFLCHTRALTFDKFADFVLLHHVAGIVAVAHILKILGSIFARLLDEHLLTAGMLQKRWRDTKKKEYLMRCILYVFMQSERRQS